MLAAEVGERMTMATRSVRVDRLVKEESAAACMLRIVAIG